MGWCHEFGPMVNPGCEHPMVAGPTSCTCAACGFECTGKFAGCAAVWERGPIDVDLKGRIDPANRDSIVSTHTPNGSNGSYVGHAGDKGHKTGGETTEVQTLFAVIDALQAEVKMLRLNLQASDAEISQLRRASRPTVPSDPWIDAPNAAMSHRFDSIRETVAERIRNRLSVSAAPAVADAPDRPAENGGQ